MNIILIVRLCVILYIVLLYIIISISILYSYFVMSSSRVTRSNPQRSPSSSPTVSRKKKPTNKGSTNKKDVRITARVVDSNNRGEGEASNEEGESQMDDELDQSTPIQPSTDRNEFNQLMARQQKQLDLLTQLAAANGGRVDSSSSSSVARSSTPKGSFDRRYKGEGGAVLDEWIAYGTQMLAFYTGLNGTQAAVWLATGLEGAALAWYQNQFKVQSIPKGWRKLLKIAQRH